MFFKSGKRHSTIVSSFFTWIAGILYKRTSFFFRGLADLFSRLVFFSVHFVDKFFELKIDIIT